MRRKDREKDTAFALDVFCKCEYATLAATNPDGTPYCVPVSVAVHNGAIYFHCALEGHKLDNIRHASAVCVSAVSFSRIVPENYSAEYDSAIATGQCAIVTDEAEKATALRAISEKYAKSHIADFDARMAKWLHLTHVCKIDIEKITGKASRQ